MTYFDIVYLCIKVRLYCSRCLCSFNLYSDVLSRNKKRREDWHWLTVLIFKKTHSSFICKVGATDNHLQLPFYTVCVYTSRKSFDNRTNLWSLIPHLTASIFHTQGRTFWSLSGLDYPIQKKSKKRTFMCSTHHPHIVAWWYHHSVSHFVGDISIFSRC